ncbi:MAG: hypothetical protein ABIH76_01195 [Candidatus Bathyarchaeota archaeon]
MVVLLSLSLMFSSVSFVNAEDDEFELPMSVSVDKSRYEPGALVTIEGVTSSNVYVSLEVRNPSNSIVVTKLPESDSQGVYTSSFRLSDTATEGSYTVSASYEGSTATATFTVAETVSTLPTSITGGETLSSEGTAKTEFVSGETVLPSLTVENSATTSTAMLVVVQVTAPDLTPMPTNYLQVELQTGQEFTFSPSVVLPSDADSGEWVIEMIVLSDFPSRGGAILANPMTINFTVT